LVRLLRPRAGRFEVVDLEEPTTSRIPHEILGTHFILATGLVGLCSDTI